MGNPVKITIEKISHTNLGQIACWLADGSVGASLVFSISQEDSDFETARNVTINILNPTVITADQLKQLMRSSFTSNVIFEN